MKFILVVILISVCGLFLPPPRLFANSEVENTSNQTQTVPEIHEEADPNNAQECFSMGRMTIDYETGEPGLPKIGFRVTDPLGRKIAYDPKTRMGQQEIPLAQAYLDCDENEETGELRECKDHIEICGPLSGTYRIELSSMESGKFSLTVSAESSTTRSGTDYAETASRAEFHGKTDGHDSTALLLRYSREAGSKIRLTRSGQRLAGK